MRETPNRSHHRRIEMLAEALDPRGVSRFSRVQFLDASVLARNFQLVIGWD